MLRPRSVASACKRLPLRPSATMPSAGPQVFLHACLPLPIGTASGISHARRSGLRRAHVRDSKWERVTIKRRDLNAFTDLSRERGQG